MGALKERLAMLVTWHLAWQGVARVWDAVVDNRDRVRPVSDVGFRVWLSWPGVALLLLLALFPVVGRAHPAMRSHIVCLTAGSMLWRFFVAWFYYLATKKPQVGGDFLYWSWGPTMEVYEARNEMVDCIPATILCVALTPYLARWLLNLSDRLSRRWQRGSGSAAR